MGRQLKAIYELEAYKEPEGNNLMIVDALNLAFRYKHAGKEEFAQDYLRTVQSLAKSYKSKNVLITCDWGKSSYRKEIYPEYKGDREAKVAAQTEEEQEDFKLFFEEFERTMEYCGQEYPVIRYKGVEADDLAAYIVQYKWKVAPDEIWLISSDKDWDLLLRENVHRFSFVTRKEYKLDNWHTYYEYPFEYALDVKALMGGKDNVLGIEGVGPKRATELVNKYGSAFDIYDSLPLPGKAKYIQNLNAFGDLILLNLQLIDKLTYCSAAIGTENVENLKSILDGVMI